MSADHGSAERLASDIVRIWLALLALLVLVVSMLIAPRVACADSIGLPSDRLAGNQLIVEPVLVVGDGPRARGKVVVGRVVLAVEGVPKVLPGDVLEISVDPAHETAFGGALLRGRLPLALIELWRPGRLRGTVEAVVDPGVANFGWTCGYNADVIEGYLASDARPDMDLRSLLVAWNRETTEVIHTPGGKPRWDRSCGEICRSFRTWFEEHG